MFLRSPLSRYGLAAALALGAFAIERLFPPFFEPIIFFLFYPTGFVTAWLAGMGPAMLHLVLGLAGVHWIFVAQEGLVPERTMILRMALFAAINVLTSWLLARGRRAEMVLLASEEALRRSEIDLKRAQAIGGIGSWRLDVSRDELVWSEQTYRMFGLAVGAPLGYRDFLAIVHPEDRAAVDEAWTAALAGKPYDIEHRILVDGAVRWVHERADLEFDAQGKALRGIGTIQDVTERKLAEQELRTLGERKRFRLALEAGAAATVIVGRDGRIVFVNSAAERLFGWTRTELVGQLVEVLIPERFRRRHVAYREGFFHEGVRRRVMGEGRDLIALRKDRMEVPVQIGLARVAEGVSEFPAEIGLTYVSEGGQDFVVATLTDISGRKAAEAALRESEDRLKLFIEYAPAALAMFDRQMQYLAASRRWLDDYSLGDREIIGKSHYEIFPEITERWKAAHRRGLSGEIVRADEDRFERTDGTVQWLRWTVRPWQARDGTVGGIVIFTEDITALKESEERLKRSLVELEAFAYTIAHDLRSPIRAVEGYSHVLAQRLAERLDPESRALLERVRQAAVRLDRLIRDLLSYAATGREKVDLEAVELDPLVSHVAAHYPQLTGARLRVRSPLGSVLAQSSLMLQVLSNLLSNAVKFIPKDRTPEIGVWTERREAGKLLIAVQDNGIGIPQEARGLVFQPFARLHPPGEHEGTGIGLAIVKRAVERMGGQVWFESEPGKGSRFWIELKQA